MVNNKRLRKRSKRSKRSKSRRRSKKGGSIFDMLKKNVTRLAASEKFKKEGLEFAQAGLKETAPELSETLSTAANTFQGKGGVRKTKITQLKARKAIASFFGKKLVGGRRRSSRKKRSRKKRSKKRQRGGELSVFDGNMKNRTFGCRQPYWKPKCI
jgi:hypothetical protein